MASIVTTEDTLRAEELAGGQDGILRRSSVGEHRFEFGGYLPEVSWALKPGEPLLPTVPTRYW
jgi:hypothetical protein